MKEKLERLRRLIEQLTLVLREERQENLRLRSRLASSSDSRNSTPRSSSSIV